MSKQNCKAKTSSKKRTYKFVFLSWTVVRIEKQIRSFVFWENQFCFEIYWPLLCICLYFAVSQTEKYDIIQWMLWVKCSSITHMPYIMGAIEIWNPFQARRKRGTLYWNRFCIVIWGCYSQNNRFVQNWIQGLLWHHIRSEKLPKATFVTKKLLETDRIG